ncbi:conserved hypothetical protein [Neospora caninum Liverpool]|uniref:KH domain-containing protein n=1 Tax=Neospora caninum (strain Liverpool) TaxID=572307 RepID=F0VMN5_NEOCL|nr:conserved hypothetical protein [Neospora caninum Liverpool]CBZ54981.1 conserved hypothetical protein [Neospora caninum Liverpool]CEL69703.1 TPA: hypothetical protein BN1204_054080 [Neospora caninum Liverpool]|eukprot:XP_003885009.1 conserved hypothetical protein [Neospora caninum Liverpool]
MVAGDPRRPSASPPARGLLPSSLMPPSFAPHPSHVSSGGSVFFGSPPVPFYPPSAPVPSSFSMPPPHDSMLLPSAPLPFPNVGEPGERLLPCGTAGPRGVSLSPLPSSFLPGTASAPPSAFPVYMHPANQPFPMEGREDGRSLASGARGVPPGEGNFLFPLFPPGASTFQDKDEKKRPRDDRDGRREDVRREDGRDPSPGRGGDRLERRVGRHDGGRSPRPSGRFRPDGDQPGEKEEWGGDRGRRDERRDPRRGSREPFGDGRDEKRGRDAEFEKGSSGWSRRGVSPNSGAKRPRQQEASSEAGLLPTPSHLASLVHAEHAFTFRGRADPDGEGLRLGDSQRDEDERNTGEGARKVEETGRARRDGRFDATPTHGASPHRGGRGRGGPFAAGKRGESGHAPHAPSRERGGWGRGAGGAPGGRRRRDESEAFEGRQRRRSSETSSSCPRNRRGSPSIQRPERGDTAGASPAAGQPGAWNESERRDGRRQSCGSSISSSLSPARDESEDGKPASPSHLSPPSAAPLASGNPFFPPVGSAIFPAGGPRPQTPGEKDKESRGAQSPSRVAGEERGDDAGATQASENSTREDGKARTKGHPELPFFFDLWVPTTFHPSCPERVRLVLGPKGRTHKEMEQLARMRIQIYGKEMIRSTRRHGYDAFRDNQPLHLVVTFDRMRREAPCAETAQRAQGSLKAFLEQLVERTWPREESRRPESFYDKQISAGPSCGPLVYVHPLGLHDEPPPKELQGCLVYKPNLFTPLQSPLAVSGEAAQPGVGGAAETPFSSALTPQPSAGEDAKKFLWGTDFSGRIFGHGFLPRAAGDEEEEARLYEGDPTLLLDCTPPLCLLLLTLQSLHALLAEEGVQSLTALPARFEEKWGVRLLHSREDFQVAGLHPSKRTQDLQSVVDKPTGDDGYGGLLSFVQEFPEVFEIVRGFAKGEDRDEDGRREDLSVLKVRARDVPEFARVANRFKATNPWLERGA